MAEVPYVCLVCDSKFRVKDPKPDAAYKCKKCGSKLEEKLEFEGEPERRVWSIPVRLGRYVIEGEIGRGGMGVIYRGKQEGLGRVVAVKMMLPGPAGDPELAQRFAREARASAALRHPNIVAVHEIGEYKGQPFFTMDYIEGKGLDKVLEQEPMAPKRCAEILRDVARAIHYAHQQGIVHRDLKPANIMIDHEGKPRITDFGLAKDLSSKSMLSVTGEVMGTPAYMSPEQAEGRIREIDAQSDLYSVGAILYRMLTGHPPFEGATVAATIYKVVHEYTTEPIKLNRLVPGDLSAICMRALEKLKKDRYASGDELAKDLSRFLRGEPVVARPISALEKVRRKLKRHKVASSIVGGVAALAIVAIAAIWIFARTDELDLIEKNLADPAMRTALFTGLEKFEDRSRARRLALPLIPELPELAMQAFERGGLDDWEEGREALARLLDKPGPMRVRAIRWFAGRGDRTVAPKMAQLLRDPEVRLDAIRYFQAVPDPHAYYQLGLLVSDKEVGSEARLAIERQYLNNVVRFFHPSLGSTGGSLSELGKAVESHNQQIEDILNEGKPKEDPFAAALEALKSAEVILRMKAAFELAATKEPRAREALLAALGDEDDGVSKMAADSLGRCQPVEFKDRLLALLRDSRPHARRGAATVLARLGDKSVRAAIDEAYKAEKDESVKDALIDALAALK